MSEISKNKRKNQKGFYLALSLCMLVIGAAAFITYSSFPSNQDQNEDNGISTTEEEIIVTENNLSNISKEQSDSSIEKPYEFSQSTAASIENSAKKVFPCGENISKNFSNENPVFCVTLNDWRAHNGTDYIATKGDTVLSIENGTVKEIKDDDMLGRVITITHSEGFEAYYCGLSNEVFVSQGDKVIAGQKIGTIDTVPCECLEETHLHIEIKKDNKYLDPAKILEDANKNE